VSRVALLTASFVFALGLSAHAFADVQSQAPPGSVTPVPATTTAAVPSVAPLPPATESSRTATTVTETTTTRTTTAGSAATPAVIKLAQVDPGAVVSPSASAPPSAVAGPSLSSGPAIATTKSASEEPAFLSDPRLKKFAGTTFDLSSYLGSGTFYATGYYDRYVSLAVYFRPSYDLGTRYKLSLNARIFMEEELTSPADANARRYYFYDPWVNLVARNLHTFDRSKIRIGGLVRTIWPVSPESRYKNLLIGAGAGLNANRDFEFGDTGDEKRKWKLSLTYGLIFYKYFNSSDFRGSGPGDTSGCRAPTSASGVTGSSGEPGASTADRCGGPANDNFAILNMALASVSRGPWSVSATLLVTNTFKYAFPSDVFTADQAAVLGRSDNTWGILSVNYELQKHLGVSAGLSSMQPALDSRYRYPRFPFFDFSGGLNANNFTQLFLSINGSL
jgi:hypothetical protein